MGVALPVAAKLLLQARVPSRLPVTIYLVFYVLSSCFGRCRNGGLDAIRAVALRGCVWFVFFCSPFVERPVTMHVTAAYRYL